VVPLPVVYLLLVLVIPVEVYVPRWFIPVEVYVLRWDSSLVMPSNPATESSVAQAGIKPRRMRNVENS